MLESVKIQRRQSEIRQSLAELVGKTEPTEDELRSITEMDSEFQRNETRLRGALIAEDTERRQAGEELETRADKEFSELVDKFEVRQVVAALDHGYQLTGQTAELVAEMRSHGAYQGVPVPLEALEVRNTVSGGLVEPKATRGIFDRLFPASVAASLGVNSVSIPHGSLEYPVATAGATAGWASGEGQDVAVSGPYQTTESMLSPDHTLGVQMRITRKAVKQTAGLEQAIRRDMSAAIGAELDRAILIGSGTGGQLEGIVTGATNKADWGAAWSTIRAEIVAFMEANAISNPGSVNMAITPAMWAELDDAIWADSVTEWNRATGHVGNITRATQLPADTAVMTVSAGGLSPAYLGLWGGVDMIRDPYSDAQSGGLRITGLLTCDMIVPRQIQVRVLEADEG